MASGGRRDENEAIPVLEVDVIQLQRGHHTLVSDVEFLRWAVQDSNDRHQRLEDRLQLLQDRHQVLEGRHLVLEDQHEEMADQYDQYGRQDTSMTTFKYISLGLLFILFLEHISHFDVHVSGPLVGVVVAIIYLISLIRRN